ncbi:hypothetical protein OG824_31740 [Streptomyces prunicolor]|uniref:hypothetical protein n=1 Tax=Streptomyces prunicolor TaxID=67348 RepID=UPI002258FAF4|nr:hypothetical protein [Streptomyces prunicolor]MCX5239783.1 hypothetical protein [Streptomyces prunicolor]
MSGKSDRELLAVIEAFESGSFRAAAVARNLLASPDVPKSNGVFPSLRHDGPSVQVVTHSIEDASTWADHFGITLSVEAGEATAEGTRYVTSFGEGETDGLRLVVSCNSVWTEAQWQAWRAQPSKDGGV